MKKVLETLMVLTILLVFGNGTLAGEPKEQAGTKDTVLMEKKAKGGAVDSQAPASCKCLETKDFSATGLLEKAYNSVQEDEWDKAIDVCKKVAGDLKDHEKKCKCQQLTDYQQIIQAFQKYAEGGRDLDNSDKPNCEKVLRLYNEAISTLKEAGGHLGIGKARKLAEEIQNYASEEKEFAEDECKGI